MKVTPTPHKITRSAHPKGLGLTLWSAPVSLATTSRWCQTRLPSLQPTMANTLPKFSTCATQDLFTKASKPSKAAQRVAYGKAWLGVLVLCVGNLRKCPTRRWDLLLITVAFRAAFPTRVSMGSSCSTRMFDPTSARVMARGPTWSGVWALYASLRRTYCMRPKD